ncbi:SLAIN motif-containing protein-like isoform X1 [Lepisosteus oculatus]|uniref:SLAIN motif-containing protein-like isoform X1 n=2 Tax=Lepisosteus oculatus TaxID=7918 RepID=UPI0037134996
MSRDSKSWGRVPGTGRRAATSDSRIESASEALDKPALTSAFIVVPCMLALRLRWSARMVVPESGSADHGGDGGLGLGEGQGPQFEADQALPGTELEEVRKLQELVRRLEIQNQQLRNRGGKTLRGDSSSCLSAACNVNDRTLGDCPLSATSLRPDDNDDNISVRATNFEPPLQDSSSSGDESSTHEPQSSRLQEEELAEGLRCGSHLAGYMELPQSHRQGGDGEEETQQRPLLDCTDQDPHTEDCGEEEGAESRLGLSALDEVEVLDLEDCDEAEDEDSWLYVSPKKQVVTEQRPESPLKWCRQVLDHPSPETEAACRTLLYRLDQTARWKNIYSSPSTQCVYSSTSETACSSTALNSPGYHKSTNKTLLTCGSSGYMSMHSALSSQSSVDSELSTSDDSISMGYKLQDLTDVQIMARLQEESLRQDYASSSASVSRRSSSASLQSLRRGTYSDQEFDTYSLEDEEEACCLSHRGHRHSPSPLGSPRCQSPSAPGEYSRVSAQRTLPPRRSLQGPGPELLKFAKSEEELRRSMPNLARTSLRSLEAVRNSRSMESNLQSPGSRISRLPQASAGVPSTRLRGSAQSPLSLRAPVKALGPVGSMGGGRQPHKGLVSPGVPSGGMRRAQSPASSGPASPSGAGAPASRAAAAGGKQTPGRSRSSLGGPTPASPRGRLAQPSKRSLGLTKTCSPVTDESWKDGCY